MARSKNSGVYPSDREIARKILRGVEEGRFRAVKDGITHFLEEIEGGSIEEASKRRRMYRHVRQLREEREQLRPAGSSMGAATVKALALIDYRKRALATIRLRELNSDQRERLEQVLADLVWGSTGLSFEELSALIDAEHLTDIK